MWRLIALSICIIVVNHCSALAVDKIPPLKAREGAKFGKPGEKKPGTPKVEKDESGKDVDFGPYIADLQRKIKRCWFPPAGNETKKVVVYFVIDQSGHLRSLSVTKSSGVRIADEAALKAVRNASPFQRLPEGAPPTVDVEFKFDYNVFRGTHGSTSTGITIGGKHADLIKAGRAAFLAKNYDLALQKFDEADKYSGYTARDVAAFRATIYDKQGTAMLAKDPKAAAELFRKALIFAPESEYVSTKLDQALEKQGIKASSYKERTALADMYISDNKYDMAEIECTHALSLATAQDRKQKSLDKQISSDLKAIEIKLQKIISTIKGRREEERWRAYLEGNKQSAEGYLGLALALEKQGKIDEAKKAVEEALVASPRNEAAEQHLKRLQELKGDVEPSKDSKEPTIR